MQLKIFKTLNFINRVENMTRVIILDTKFFVNHKTKYSHETFY